MASATCAQPWFGLPGRLVHAMPEGETGIAWGPGPRSAARGLNGAAPVKFLRAVVAIVAVALGSAHGKAESSPETRPAWMADEARYHYSVLDQPIADVLREFGASVATPVVIGTGIDGRVMGLSGDFTQREFLDELAQRFALAWYHDGEVLHVSEASEMSSIIIDLEAVSSETMARALSELGLQDARYPIRVSADSNVGILTAPPRYTELVENAFLMMSERAKEVAEEIVPAKPDDRRAVVVIRAADVSIWRGGAEESSAAPEAAVSAGGGDQSSGD